jgi:O-antigen/teichoic acid export membrane protein
MRTNILIRNIASQSIMQVANLVLPFLTIPYLTKIIGPDKFGIINYCTAIVTYFVLIVNFSFDMHASRSIAQNPDDKAFTSRLFSDIFYTKLLLFLVCTLTFGFLLFSLPQLVHEKKVAVYSFLILVGWLFTPNWLYQGKQQLGKVAMFNLGAKIIFTAAVFIFIHQKSEYVWQPLILSVSQVLVGLLSFFIACRKYHIKLLRSNWKNILALLKEGKEIFFSMVTINLYSNTTIVILGIFVTVTQVGYYSAAYRLIITAISVLSIPLTQALYPFISGSFRIDRNKGIKDLQSIMPVCLLFSFIYSLTFFLMAPFIINLFYGAQFYPAIAVFRILSIVPFLVSINSFLGVQALLNLKMDRQFFRITLTSAIVGVVTAAVLGHFTGIIGGAISWLIAETCNCVLYYLALNKMSINLFSAEYFTYGYFRKITQKGFTHVNATLLKLRRT